MDKDAFYFPHFSNARNDRKLRRVRKELGLEGYGIYFALLEVLREQKGFKYPIEDLDLLADDFGTSEQKVRAVVTLYGLFQSDDETFFSIKFEEYLTPYLDAKHRKKINANKGNLIRYGHATKEQLAEMTDQQVLDMAQDVRSSRLAIAKGSHSDRTALAMPRKRKEKKVNKVNENKSNNIEAFASCDLFQSSEVKAAWDEWMKVRARKKASKTDNAITRAINKLVKLSKGDTDLAVQILNKSSDSGWSDLYELKPKFVQQSMFDNNNEFRPEGRVLNGRR